jgi:hypothetical protein
MKRNLIFLVLTLLCAGMFALFLVSHRSRTDLQPPEITFSQQMPEVSVQDKEALLEGVTATDRKDGDVSQSVVVSEIRLLEADGTIQVTYAAFDRAGNVTQATRKAKFTDYESPRFSLKSSMTFPLNSGFDVFREVQASDMLDGDISHRVRITSMDEKTLSALGVSQVELRVSNSLGDTVKLEIPVEVYDPTVYSAKLTLTDYLVYVPVGTQLQEKSYLQNYIRGNVTLDLQKKLPEGCALNVKSNVRSDVPGVYTVEYRLTQTMGTNANTSSYTGYAKLIVVVEG